MLAAQAAREKAVELALVGRDAPFPRAAPDDVIVTDSRLSLARTNLNITYAELLARNGLSSLVGDGDYDPVEEVNGSKAIFSFSAVFAEVRVDPDFGLVRLNRVVGAYDAGRIINPKTARSHAIGGVIWGVGQALLEQSETDPAMGRFLNRNYSGYLVPTNADIPELDVLFVGEFDEEASPLGAKGLGELTAVSVAPAIANAVYHATGKRVRSLPITVKNCSEATTGLRSLRPLHPGRSPRGRPPLARRCSSHERTGAELGSVVQSSASPFKRTVRPITHVLPQVVVLDRSYIGDGVTYRHDSWWYPAGVRVRVMASLNRSPGCVPSIRKHHHRSCDARERFGARPHGGSNRRDEGLRERSRRGPPARPGPSAEKVADGDR